MNVGNNVHINRYCYIQAAGGVTIHNNVHIGPHLTLYSTSHNYEGKALPYDETLIRKTVTIEDNVWIGACVTIVPGITIGEGSIIAAGSVVAKDVKKLSIVGSPPAKLISERNESHYSSLKAEKKFGGRGGKLIKQ